MKTRISSYIQAERLIRENAAIDIADLIRNNERLLEAAKNFLKYSGMAKYRIILEQAIRKAEGKL